MHFVILVTLIVIASGTDISEARYVRHDISQISPPPSEINHEQFEDNGGYGRFNNQNRQADYRQDSNSGYNRDIINGRSRSFANVNQERSRVFPGNVNHAFDGQMINRHNHGNLNHPEQSFINNEYPNVDSTYNNDRAHEYQQNVLQARRQEDSMVFENNDNYNRRKTNAEPNNSNLSRDNMQNQDVVFFLNEQNNRPDQNEGNHNHNTYHDNNRNGFTANSHIFINANENHLKTTEENEVTDRSFRNDAIEREYRTVNEDKWVWGGESKTEMGASTTSDPTTASFTLDDRAAFSGDKCASGMAKFLGQCLEVD